LKGWIIIITGKISIDIYHSNLEQISLGAIIKHSLRLPFGQHACV